MQQAPSSQHLRTAVELTLVANIRRGFVASLETMSYATRLGLLLNLLFELRKTSVEHTGDDYIGPLERLRTLHFVRWSIFDSGSKLLLAVSFDRPWEPYIRAIADEAGPLLDVIFCHCEGYEGHSTSDGYVRFAQWVRAHQVPVSFFHAAEPDLTSDDLRYLKEFERRYWQNQENNQSFQQQLLKMVLGARGSDGIPSGAHPISPIQSERAREALNRVGRYFLEPNDRAYFEAASSELLNALPAVIAPPEHSCSASSSRINLTPSKPAPPAAALEGAKPDGAMLDDVQGNILDPYLGVTHGCVALVGFASGAAARATLERLLDEELVTTATTKPQTYALNLALTYEGLKTLGLSADHLAALPREFCEGMVQRAGLLGDVGPDHPSAWLRPPRNGRSEFPNEKHDEVELSCVDMVVVLQCRGTPPHGSNAPWSKQHPLYPLLGKELLNGADVELLHVQPWERRFWPEPGASEPRAVQEHFGYKDGLSQPVVQGHHAVEAGARQAVAMGEVILGYPNDRGAYYEPARAPEVGADAPEPSAAQFVQELVHNGTFMVLRKLQQDVAGLRRFVHGCAATLPDTQDLEQRTERVYALLMGRFRDGRLVHAEESSSSDFDFDADSPSDGNVGCPVASHIRRTNPRLRPQEIRGRKLTTPRIVRRGFSYGPPLPEGQLEDDGVDRGLLFVAYNASIAQQFELVQAWIQGGNSSGAPSTRACPIASNRRDLVFPVAIPNSELVTVWKREQPFVRLHWGMYLFTPSISGLRQLAQLEPVASLAESEYNLAERGRELIVNLQRLEALEREARSPEATPSIPGNREDGEAFVRWKTLLEDISPQAQQQARAVWCAIQHHFGGVLRTPYGVLVANRDAARMVLSDESTFSVRRYWERMSESIGPLHLGMDRCPARVAAGHRTAQDELYETHVTKGSHHHLGGPIHRQLEHHTHTHGPTWWRRAYDRHIGKATKPFDTSNPCDLAWSLGEHLLTQQPTTPDGRARIDLAAYARFVVSEVSRRWFGFPNAPSPSQSAGAAGLSFEDFYAVACYVFYPHPEPHVRVAAKRVQDKLLLARQAPPFTSEILDNASFEQRLACTQGFLIATFASLVSVLKLAVQEKWLWRLQWRLSSASTPEAVHSSARTAISSSLTRAPTPHLLHRKPVRPTQLGAVLLDPSDYVVVGLAAVMADPRSTANTPSDFTPLSWAFGGGDLGSQSQPPHACPGQEIGLTVIEGAILSLCQRSNVRSEAGLQVSYALNSALC